MNTAENNKLIAEFRKLSEHTDAECIIGEFMNYELIAINKPFVAIKSNNGTVHFKSDWNWLMEVVEKIFKDFYKLNPCPIGLKMAIEKALINVNIEQTYCACVEFIKWYNQQKS